MDLLSLPVLTVLSDNVTIVEKDNVKIVRIIHEKATAGIALHGGHVVSFAPKGQDDLIWMSDQAIFDGKAALRGGIPVCWPWFGRIATPAHGFARNSEWHIAELTQDAQNIMLVLELKSSEDTLEIWPYQFSARLLIEVGSELKVTLDVTNTDSQEWTFSGALHTYLNVGNVQDVTTTGMGLDYIDQLKQGQQCQGSDVLQLNHAIDRVYTQPDNVIAVIDPHIDRTLRVENQGHNAAVLWNPWASGAQLINDMANNGYQTMLCVESTLHASRLEKGKTLRPGESYPLSTRISVQ
ncbi:D-hexose-6-phosphate mutarotase [Vibrio ostreicida]|uniref:D-hexose-6-phosphate mutarotase n=1 Tax=Vibrio ostreicida TaxID=526588 RepID=UPI0009707146|nr:D-hexose-6-phosphate mutarotase [Vibrio ostreicida]